MPAAPRLFPTKDLLAEQTFRCHPRNGEPFDMVAKFSRPVLESVPEPVGRHAVMFLSFEPLVGERRFGGGNEFQAICLAIEYLRTTLRAFVASGGRVYWQDTDSLVDLESPWLGPFPSPGDFAGSWWQGEQK